MGRTKPMNANLQQAGRISRCYRYIRRRNPDAALESVAREWISRYSRRWRDHYHPEAAKVSSRG